MEYVLLAIVTVPAIGFLLGIIFVHLVFKFKVRYPKTKRMSFKFSKRSVSVEEGELAYTLGNETPRRKNLVIFMHGLGGSAALMQRFSSEKASTDCSFMAVDAFSHGRSDKRGLLKLPTFIKELDYGIKQGLALGWKAEEIILCGYSLGGSAAMACATRHNVKAVIAVAPLVDVPDSFCRIFDRAYIPHFMQGILIRYINFNVRVSIRALSPISMISDVTCPVYILAAEKDDLTTLAEADSLLQLNSKVVISSVKRGHTDILFSPKTKAYLSDTFLQLAA